MGKLTLTIIAFLVVFYLVAGFASAAKYNLLHYSTMEDKAVNDMVDNWVFIYKGLINNKTGFIGNGTWQNTSIGNNYINVSASNFNEFISPMPFSVQAWVYMSQNNAQTLYVFDKYDSGSNNRSWGIYVDSSECANFVTCPYGNSSNCVTSTSTTCGAGIAFLITAVYDGTTQYLYINGTLEDSDASNGYYSSYASYVIGAQTSNWAGSNAWNGTEDEIAVYNMSLAASEVKALWQKMARGKRPYENVTYYVAGNGSDSNDGLSIDTPWLTLNYSVNQLADGDTLLVMAGNYSRVTLVGRTFNDNITIRNYNSNLPNVTGKVSNSYTWTDDGGGFWHTHITSPDTDQTPRVYLENKTKFFTFNEASNFTSENPYPYSSYYTGTTLNIKLSDLTEDPNTMPIVITTHKAILLDSNIMSQDAFIKIQGLVLPYGYKQVYADSQNNLIIDGNYFYGYKNAVYIDGGDNVWTNNTVVSNNYFHGAAEDYWYQNDMKKQNNEETEAIYAQDYYGRVYAYNNNITRSGGGITLESDAATEFSNSEVVNNTFWYGKQTQLEIEEFCYNSSWHDNEVYYNSYSAVSFAPANAVASPSNCTFYNNTLSVPTTGLWSAAEPTQGTYTIKAEARGTGAYTSKWYIHHNTFYGIDRCLNGINDGSFLNNMTWIDNIFYCDLEYILLRTGSANASYNNMFDYNLYYSPAGGYNPFARYGDDANSTQYATLAAAIAAKANRGRWDNHSVESNPLFTDLTNLNFMPLITSPACSMSSTGSYVGALPCLTTNLPPTIDSVVILNATAYKNTTLIAECNATDPEGATLAYSYNWYRNTTLLGYNITYLRGNFSKNDFITFYCNVTDGTNNVSLNSSILTISNTRPTIPVISSISGSTITYNSTDQDGDLVIYYIFVNESLYTVTTATTTNLGLGDGNYNITMTAYDGTDNSTMSGYTYFGVNSCGNGIIGAGEQCDGSNLNGYTCEDFGFNRGTLGCTITCRFDTSPCEMVNLYIDSLYNVTPAVGSANLASFVSNVNEGVGQMLVNVFFLAFFFIFLMGLKRYPMEDVLPALGFVFFVLSILLRQAGLISFYMVELFFFIMAAGVAYHFIKGD